MNQPFKTRSGWCVAERCALSVPRMARDPISCFRGDELCKRAGGRPSRASLWSRRFDGFCQQQGKPSTGPLRVVWPCKAAGVYLLYTDRRSVSTLTDVHFCNRLGGREAPRRVLSMAATPQLVKAQDLAPQAFGGAALDAEMSSKVDDLVYDVHHLLACDTHAVSPRIVDLKEMCPVS